ncbi:MAG: PIG-L family deacetylase [Chloroflexi bacterium]|nr:PIG-L family deacetylase [Chloroflexota bacterium]
MTRRLYLSPHFDDAILSCGGLIHRQRARGEPVTVVTLCAGYPPAGPLSAFARELHANWGQPPDVVGARRAEDREVLARRGVGVVHGDTPDAIYRRVGDQFPYHDNATLFGALHPAELAALRAEWQRTLQALHPNRGQVQVFAPLAIGNHVDHQWVRALALALQQNGWRVWFYEDYPYAEQAGAAQAARAWFGAGKWQSRSYAVDVQVKTEAILGYATQWPFLFGSEAALRERVRNFTAQTARDLRWPERLRARLIRLMGRRERPPDGRPHAERIWRWTG